MKQLISLLLVLSLLSSAAFADESIVDYHSDIQIQTDGQMIVDEHIRVVAEGDTIRHGIYRDFPTDYRDRHHNRYKVGFEVLGATLDGKPVQWHDQRLDNGVRVYVGDPEQMVSHGTHQYTIRYRTHRQLGFFDDHDELYWNVTGSGWALPIRQASASIRLPEAIPTTQLSAQGFTGDKGSTTSHLVTRLQPGGADYQTTRSLGPHQNLTVVLQFPKGVITEPDAMQKARWLLKDNRSLLLSLLGLAAIWMYYLWLWHRFGRDPESGPLVPIYEPPKGQSAASLRYVRRMSYDKECLSTAVLDLAAQGYVQIQQGHDDIYTLTRADKALAESLPTDNKTVLTHLFRQGTELRLEQGNHEILQTTLVQHQKSLITAYARKYFLTNSLKMWPGWLLTLGVVACIGMGSGQSAWFILIFLGIWTVALIALIQKTMNQQGKGARPIASWFLVLAFAAGEITMLFEFGRIFGYAIVPVFIGILATNLAFYHWMKAPTLLGAKLLHKINGFRWYLGVAEKQDLDSRYQPESRPELFARYLPYAHALDVGNAWAARFAEALSFEQMQKAKPNWYHGAATGGLTTASFSALSGGISSGLSGAISSSSVAPGSSSGGGGFSGGGGGGGGGGGW